MLGKRKSDTLQCVSLEDLDVSEIVVPTTLTMLPNIETTMPSIEFNVDVSDIILPENEDKDSNEFTISITTQKSSKGRPSNVDKYNTSETKTLASIFREYRVNHNTANMILKTISSSTFKSENVAPNWHYLTSVEKKFYPRKVTFTYKFLLICRKCIM